ncbi:hypothetical protein KQX54_010379 [Cotesia glomerata]|uniref:Uncharacterized protein n=2 Tax=Cotesia glomerata TaxID=32391 RepID=A0AAV7I1N1_COTGL|nr:hypothetical protein KQX54_010379 [Cotesia glomerata]
MMRVSGCKFWSGTKTLEELFINSLVINSITIGSVIHIDGAFSKFISLDSDYNNGNVSIELVIQSNTVIDTIPLSPAEVIPVVEEDYPLITIEEAEQYLKKKIRMQGYVKTNFDTVKIKGENSFICCGSMASESGFKIEIKIIQFKKPFKSPFSKGDHIEAVGIMKNYLNHATIILNSLENMKKLDEKKMPLHKLVLANKELKFQNQDEYSYKKQKRF